MSRVFRVCAGAALLLPVVAYAAESDLCAPPPGGLPILAPLEHSAARIDRGGPLDIVAVGSSSTAGTGASSPDLSYPSRLEVELRRRLPNVDTHVVNRGKGGEDAPEELARLPNDVVALHPDLVVWQVGTNAVLRRDDLGADREWMREGVELLKRDGIDVVLMDLQVAPKILDRAGYATMEQIIADTADGEHVGLFRRFALMRYWQTSHAVDAPPMIGADGLHMTDAGYGCLAADLANALQANWHAENKLAHRVHGTADAVAGLPPGAGKAPRAVAAPEVMRRNDAIPFN